MFPGDYMHLIIQLSFFFLTFYVELVDCGGPEYANVSLTYSHTNVLNYAPADVKMYCLDKMMFGSAMSGFAMNRCKNS